MAVIDVDGQLVAKRRITDDADGLAELLGMLESVGDTSNDPIPVAIETPRGLLVAALRATGRPVYAINPMAVARYRERHSVARKKSDHVDAMTLANILRTDAHIHRQLPADSDWFGRSRCWHAPLRMPPGDLREPPKSCGRCCASTTPRSLMPLPEPCTPTSPNQRHALSWRSPPPRSRAPS
ncbi:MAG: transposase [Mycobacterium sp.]